MLKNNFKEYNNKWQRKNINPVISFSKNPGMDKNYIDRFLFSCLLKTSNKIKTFNIYQSLAGISKQTKNIKTPYSLSFGYTEAGLDKNNKKFDLTSSNKINKLNINSLSIFAYNNFLKNKQNIYKENEFLNKTPYLKTKIASKWNNNIIRWFPHIENKAYQGIKLNNLTTLKGYLNLNFENFSSKGKGGLLKLPTDRSGNKNNYITGNNPFKNKIIIDIGAHITTISYKKVIFEQRELFQIRKIYNEYSGKNTHIFNFLKTFCKYIFSPNELNDNILFKSYLNRLNSKYLNKLVNNSSQNIVADDETLLAKKKETEKIKYLLNVLTQSKKIKLINILKKKEIENNLTNAVAAKHISLFQNDLNETDSCLKAAGYTNWGKINNYTYTNVIKQLNINNGVSEGRNSSIDSETTQNALNIDGVNEAKKNNKYISPHKEINGVANWNLQNQQEENQLKLFKYLHNIFFKTPNISKSDVNIHLNDNNINTNILIKSLLGQYLNNIEFANINDSNNLQNNELKNINYLTIEEINAYSTYKTNWISSLILNMLPWLEKQNNSKKDTLTNILNKNIKNTNINYNNTLKESQNAARVTHAISGAGELLKPLTEKILLLPFFYEKNPTEIKENLEKINNINFFNFEGQNQDNFLITNEIYPWNITNIGTTNKENFAENTNKEIDIKRDSNLAIENEILINNENNNKTIYQNNIKDNNNISISPPYISINSLLLILNRLIHKKSIEFIFTTKHMYTSIFYLKYYWLYLYNHFYPDSFKMDWNIPLNQQKNNKYLTPNLSNEDTINFEEKITKNTLQTNLILGKNKKILSTNLHVQFLKSRYYLKMINTNYFQKNIKYKNTLNDSHSKFNIESNSFANRSNPINENNTNVIKQNENWEKENNEEFNFINTLNDSTHLEKHKETYLNWNKGNYTKKLIALLMYKKKQKGTNKSANNFNFNNISLNNSNQGFLININRNKLTILQTDVSVYNSLNLIDLCF